MRILTKIIKGKHRERVDHFKNIFISFKKKYMQFLKSSIHILFVMYGGYVSHSP